MNTLNLYTNNLTENENTVANDNNISKNEKIVQNISLNNKQSIKKLFSNTQALNCNSNHYEFINNKLLIDSNISNHEDHIKDNGYEPEVPPLKNYLM